MKLRENMVRRAHIQGYKALQSKSNGDILLWVKEINTLFQLFPV